MRLWSLHPKYLDRQALVAGWREALLAKAVIAGLTNGYRHHPQLERFQQHPDPAFAINLYLKGLYEEALRRSYRFDSSKIGSTRPIARISVSTGQLDYEWLHLLAKVEHRSREWLHELENCNVIECHPIFTVEKGPVALWERVGTNSDNKVLPKSHKG